MKYEVEYLDREGLAALQLERLQKIAAHACANVPYYTKVFADLGMEPGDLKSLDDLLELPLTDKETLRQNYPFGMFAVPMAEVKEIHASSGTTGKPTVVAYTQSDIEVWSEVMARSLACAGATSDDVVQNAYGYGLFTGGLGVHYGCLELGAAVVPISASCSSWRTSAPPSSPAPLPTPSSWPKRRAVWASTPPKPPCSAVCWAQSPGARGCAARSKRPGI